MITKYLAVFRTSRGGTFYVGRVPACRAFYMHLPRLRFYIRVGELA